jgi:hypothetical protein
MKENINNLLLRMHVRIGELEAKLKLRNEVNTSLVAIIEEYERADAEDGKFEDEVEELKTELALCKLNSEEGV